MIRDGAIFHPYDYAIQFYAKYPATNLPYGPFFYALNFATAFAVFGISFFVARCVTVFYTFLAALICWYIFSKIYKNTPYGLLTASAFLLNPLTGITSRDILPGVALIFFSLLTIYFFYRYVEDDENFFGILSALAFSLGYLTKPYIIPLGLALFIYCFVQRKWSLLLKLETWIAITIAIILITPQTVLAFIFSQNELGPRVQPPLDFDLLVAYPLMMMKLLPVMSSLALIGFIIGLRRNDKLTILSLIWLVCSVAFFVIRFRRYEFNYLYSFLPALLFPFTICCMSAFEYLPKKKYKAFFVVFLSIWFIYSASSTPVYFVRGYQNAGNYVARHPVGKTVLYYGNYDGSFMLGIRQIIPKGGPYVLRGDRQLAIRMSYGDMKESVLVESVQDIIAFLNRHKTGYVVVEHDMPKRSNYTEYQLLLSAVQRHELFEPVADFEVESNYTDRGSSKLVIYKFNLDDSSSQAAPLHINIPTCKKEFIVSIQ
jgi:hypothetical protein